MMQNLCVATSNYINETHIGLCFHNTKLLARIADDITVVATCITKWYMNDSY